MNEMASEQIAATIHTMFSVMEEDGTADEFSAAEHALYVNRLSSAAQQQMHHQDYGFSFDTD